MTNEELNEVLKKHKLWRNRKEGGKKACLFRADLRGVRLCDADLRGADLSGADLRGANLQDADLSNAELSGANLSYVDLCGADLCGADLCDADLRGADLRGVRLRGVCLCGADLRVANLRGANLQDADLCDAELSGANLSCVDLCGADVDFAAWPMSCGSLSVNIDSRLAAQLVYHAVRAAQSACDDEGVRAFCNAPEVIALANRFHRVDECGEVKPVGEKVKHG